MRLFILIFCFLFGQVSFAKNGAYFQIIGVTDKSGKPIENFTVTSKSGHNYLLPPVDRGGGLTNKSEVCVRDRFNKDTDICGVSFEPAPIQLSLEQRENYERLIEAYRTRAPVRVRVDSESSIVGTISNINLRNYNSVTFDVTPSDSAARSITLDKFGTTVVVERIAKN